MNNKLFRKIALSLLLVALVMAAGIMLTNVGRRVQGRDAQPASKLEALGDNVLAALSVPAAEAGPVSVDLCASNGTIELPDGANVDVWGFVDITLGGSCTANLINSTNFLSAVIQAMAGDDVTINLSNSLPVTTSVMIPGQAVAATGDADGGLTAGAAPNGGIATYEFTAQAGTYLYESGTNAGIQVPMGLYGALIVDHANGQAYAGAGSAYDVDATLLLGEIDPNLNGSPGAFDLLTYHPTYWLINGKAYSDTANIEAMSGQKVLLRYLNAGFDYPSMALLGAYQQVIAKEGYELTNAFDVVAETIPAGTTADMIVDTAGLEGSYPLYNRNMYVTNGDAFPGGMLTFLQVQVPIGNAPTIDIASPAQGSTVFGNVVPIEINASDVDQADSTLTVQWNVDGGSWQMASWTGGSSFEDSWDTTTYGDGAHAINARVTDGDGNITTDSNSVIVSNQPAASIVAPAEGTTIFGDSVQVQIGASDAEDDPGGAGLLTVEWNVDGVMTTTAVYSNVTGYYEAVLDTTSLADGAHTINAQATDSSNFVGSDSNNVTVSNLPSLTIVNPADGANVFGQVTVRIDASDAEDDAGGAGGLTVTWDVDGGSAQPTTYNVGTGYYEASLDTTSLVGPNHTVNAQMMDSRGNMASDSNSVMITPPNSIHIGDLDDASVQAGGPNWSARVTAGVHDINHAAVAGATVFMDVTRTAKADGTLVTEDLSCITGANGRCTIARTVNENQYENAVTFTVTSVTNPPADPYDSGLNHDPDGESDGTTLVVDQP